MTVPKAKLHGLPARASAGPQSWAPGSPRPSEALLPRLGPGNTISSHLRVIQTGRMELPHHLNQPLGAGDNHSPHLSHTHRTPDLDRGRTQGIPKGGALGRNSNPTQHRPESLFPTGCQGSRLQAPKFPTWSCRDPVACSLVTNSCALRGPQEPPS